MQDLPDLRNRAVMEIQSTISEVVAAFFSLLIAQQMRAPAAVVCTSGSALLNFYPDIVAALYSNFPLIVISADRMPYSIDIGDGQTIQQKGVFEPHLVAQAYLTPDVSHATKTLIDNPNQNLIKKNYQNQLWSYVMHFVWISVY